MSGMSAPMARTGGVHFWDDLDPATRETLDLQFLRELSAWDVRGLTDDGVRAYLAFRHERPDAAITTYEEGQIRRMLRRYRDPALVPDPVALEPHDDPLERFGAERLHLTSMETYWVVLALVGIVGLAALVYLVAE